jgi:adenosine deaminase
LTIIDPALPLIDLHRHLDGSIRRETILALGRQHDLDLPAWTVETLAQSLDVIDDVGGRARSGDGTGPEDDDG